MGGCVFVTGGSSGIGLAAACLLAKGNARVALFARDPGRLEAAVATVLAAGTARGEAGRVRGYSVDVADAGGVAAAVARAVAELGVPDRVILSAGIVVPGETFGLSPEVHRRHMEVNHFGCLNVIAAVLPHLKPGAGIGIVGSAAGLVGIHGLGAYTPSKYALRGMAEVLRVELAARGIGVTLCMPPDTETPMLAEERRARHPVTARIAGAGPGLAPEAVAAALIRGMAAGRFLVLPGFGVWLCHWLGPLVGPILRWRQIGLLRRLGQGPGGDG